MDKTVDRRALEAQVHFDAATTVAVRLLLEFPQSVFDLQDRNDPVAASLPKQPQARIPRYRCGPAASATAGKCDNVHTGWPIAPARWPVWCRRSRSSVSSTAAVCVEPRIDLRSRLSIANGRGRQAARCRALLQADELHPGIAATGREEGQRMERKRSSWIKLDSRPDEADAQVRRRRLCSRHRFRQRSTRAGSALHIRNAARNRLERRLHEERQRHQRTLHVKAAPACRGRRTGAGCRENARKCPSSGWYWKMIRSGR